MEPFFYVGKNLDADIINRSSSGGIMTAVAEWIINSGGIVFGASLVDRCRKIEHISVKSIDELDKIRKSKYVRSNYSACLSEMKNVLSQDKPTLFIGTPCQCMSVWKRFKDYPNLYLLDFFCHGTIEERYYTSYIDSLNVCVQKVDFRKCNLEKKHNFTFSVIDKENRVIVEEDYDKNEFTNLFVSSAGLRKACFSCSFCESTHIANITMGDVEFDEMASNHGFIKEHLSVIAVNNERGKELFEKVSHNIEYAKLDERDNKNIAFYYRKRQNTCEPWGYDVELRNWFEEEYNKYGYIEAAHRCTYIKELQILKKYETYLNNKKVVLYGAGKKGLLFKKLITEHYPTCNLMGYMVTNKQKSYVNDLPVYEMGELDLKSDDYFFIISVEKKNDLKTILVEKGLVEGINFG